MDTIQVENIDFGPCEAHFGSSDPIYLGRTQGESTVEYGIETFELETEEDGVVDEIVTADQLNFTIPLVYTDVDHLNNVIPWSEVIEDGTTGDKKLEIPKAIGERLSNYADELTIHPLSQPDDDMTKDVTLHKAYPKPGPIELGYARDGTRIANVTFVALEDSSGDYMTIGDPSITAS